MTEYLTLPNLQVSYIPTCMYAGTTSAGNHSFIHPLPPFLPPSRLPAWYMSVCVAVPVRPFASVYVRVSVRVHVHTYIQYPCIPTKGTCQRYISKVHIKDTCTRVSWGMWLFFCLFKNIFADPIDTKNHPTNVRAPALSFTTSLGEFMCKPKQNFPFKLAP